MSFAPGDRVRPIPSRGYPHIAGTVQPHSLSIDMVSAVPHCGNQSP